MNKKPRKPAVRVPGRAQEEEAQMKLKEFLKSKRVFIIVIAGVTALIGVAMGQWGWEEALKMIVTALGMG
jgi:hypothetical protein